MKTLKIMGGWLLAALVLLQFVRIDVPPPPEASAADEIKAPRQIMTLLKNACYDCHSNHTRWPWYSRISPISIEINSHVRNGRKWLNFSIWNRYDAKKRKKLLEESAESVEWKMPPADYMYLHKEARLKPEERKMLKEWAQREADKL